MADYMPMDGITKTGNTVAGVLGDFSVIFLVVSLIFFAITVKYKSILDKTDEETKNMAVMEGIAQTFFVAGIAGTIYKMTR